MRRGPDHLLFTDSYFRWAKRRPWRTEFVSEKNAKPRFCGATLILLWDQFIGNRSQGIDKSFGVEKVIESRLPRLVWSRQFPEKGDQRLNSPIPKVFNSETIQLELFGNLQKEEVTLSQLR